MNGWFFSAEQTARERRDDARRQAASEAAARRARAGRHQHGSLALARQWAAGRLHRLADSLEPRPLASGGETLTAGRADGRPIA